MRRRRVVRGGATWGRELGAGAFSVSPQGRALRTRLWHIRWVGRGKEDPSSVAARAATPSPRRGEGFGGSWKPAGDIGPLRRGGACPRLSLACSVTGTGGGGPLIRRGSRRDTFPPQGGRLLGRLEACGRSWASAQGRGLPPPVPGMFCDWYGGEEDPSSAAARAATPSPHRGEGFWGGARCIDGSREEEAGPFEGPASFLFLLEPIAHPAEGDDPVAVRDDGTADMLDVGVQGAGVSGELPAPDNV